MIFCVCKSVVTTMRSSLVTEAKDANGFTILAERNRGALISEL